ncbi:MAG: WxL protein peptidoglycan domain-containing protein [Acidimicrobiales bacterium]
MTGRLAITIVCALVCALVLLLAWPALSAADSGGGGVGAAPPPGAPGVLASGDYFAPSLAPGSTWTSVLLVSNNSSKAAPIVVYAADGLTAYSSGAVYSNLGQPLGAAGTWLTPASQTVMVRAEGETTVRFKVTVPRNATPGDHLAGIVAQSGTPTQSGSGQLRVDVITRAVVGVLVRVPGPASFDVKVGKPTIGRGPEQIGEVVTPITDTGRLIGKPVDSVSLKGPDGYDRTLQKNLDTILPGGTAYFPVYWPDHLHGLYTITSCVSGAGLGRTICNSATVNIGGSTNTVGQTARKHASSPLRVPTWLIALLSAGIGCALTAGVMRFRQSRRRKRRPGVRAPEHAVKASARSEQAPRLHQEVGLGGQS